jgi:hypothetical protein
MARDRNQPRHPCQTGLPWLVNYLPLVYRQVFWMDFDAFVRTAGRFQRLPLLRDIRFIVVASQILCEFSKSRLEARSRTFGLAPSFSAALPPQ